MVRAGWWRLERAGAFFHIVRNPNTREWDLFINRDAWGFSPEELVSSHRHGGEARQAVREIRWEKELPRAEPVRNCTRPIFRG